MRMAVFAAMVTRVDQGVGDIVRHLRETGDLENTLVIITSDNGACYEWGPFGFDGTSRSGVTKLHTGEELMGMGGPGTMPNIPGVELDPQKLSQSAYIGPRRFYRIVVTGHAGLNGTDSLNNPKWRVSRTIIAVWDQQGFSASTGQRGNYVYWRQE